MKSAVKRVPVNATPIIKYPILMKSKSSDAIFLFYGRNQAMPLTAGSLSPWRPGDAGAADDPEQWEVFKGQITLEN